MPGRTWPFWDVVIFLFKDRRDEGAVMGKVTSEISMSLDGFITGPNVRVGNGMGDDGDRLHDWRFDAKTETDAAIVDEIYASTGAVLLGKRMFDVGSSRGAILRRSGCRCSW